MALIALALALYIDNTLICEVFQLYFVSHEYQKVYDWHIEMI